MSETEPKRRGRPPKERPEAAPAEPVWIHPDSLWNEYGGPPPTFAHGSQDQASAQTADVTVSSGVAVDASVDVIVGID